jgi:hypothetical protein
MRQSVGFGPKLDETGLNIQETRIDDGIQVLTLGLSKDNVSSCWFVYIRRVVAIIKGML